MNDNARCPSCDTANSPHATFCQHCGRPMGAHAAAAPAGTFTTTATGGSSKMGAYMIGAVTVAVVLIVGGTLFFLADGDDREPEDAVREVAADVTSTAPSQATLPPTTQAPTTQIPAAEAPAITLPPTTVPPSAAPPSTVPPTTAAPSPPSPPPTTAAPVPTVAPGVGTVTFDQAVAFFSSYIATAVNGDYVTAWNMLSERDQRDYERGFDQFVGFWQSVSFADVQRVDSLGGGPSFQSMRADMAYGQADGDPTSFEVIDVDVNVRPDGVLQIFDYRFVGTQ